MSVSIGKNYDMLKRKYKIDLNKANFRLIGAYKVQFAGPISFLL